MAIGQSGLPFLQATMGHQAVPEIEQTIEMVRTGDKEEESNCYCCGKQGISDPEDAYRN